MHPARGGQPQSTYHQKQWVLERRRGRQGPGAACKGRLSPATGSFQII